MTQAPKTVLVVEDEPDVRLYLQTALEDAGFRVLTAGDGVEGLRLANENMPDLISLDLVLPKKSGARMFHEMRRDAVLRDIPVLIVTAHGKNEEVSADLESVLANSTLSTPGGYLEKPVRASNYITAVQHALGIEETAPLPDKIELKEELGDLLRKADPADLRRALDALKLNKDTNEGDE